MKNTIIIIGAGASFSAPMPSLNNKAIIQPPLINHLFENHYLRLVSTIRNIKDYYPNLMGIISSFTSSQSNNGSINNSGKLFKGLCLVEGHKSNFPI